MKIIINACSVYKGGSEQVVISFINECRHIADNEYHILLRDNIYQQLELDTFQDNFIFHRYRERPATGILNYIKTIRSFNKLEQRINADCVISTGGHGYWRPISPLIAGFNIPHFVYPESPFFNMLSLKQKVFWKIKKRINLFYFNRPDALFVQTDDVKNRLQKFLPDKDIHIVSNTVSNYFLQKTSFASKLPNKKKNEIRLLTISSYYQHKNIEIIREVVKELARLNHYNYRFVLTLPEQLFTSIFDDNDMPYLYNAGPVPIKECPSLYEECDFMFLPTLLECFSASYAEAMVMGKPILTSDLGFAHTVCNDAAIYFNPLDAKDIAQKIIQLTDDTSLQKKLVALGKNRCSMFGTSKRRAMEYISICERLIEKAKK